MDHLGVERFGDELSTFWQVAFARPHVAACDQNADLRPSSGDLTREAQTITAVAELHIREKESDTLPTLFKLSDRLDYVSRIQAAESSIFDNVARIHPDEWIVVDD